MNSCLLRWPTRGQAGLRPQAVTNRPIRRIISLSGLLRTRGSILCRAWGEVIARQVSMVLCINLAGRRSRVRARLVARP